MIYAAYTYSILNIFDTLPYFNDTAARLDRANSTLISVANNSLLFDKNGSLSLKNFSSKELLRKFNSIDLETSLSESSNGILFQLCKQIIQVITIGFRYYPLLLCIELKRQSKVCYLVCSIFVAAQLVYYVYMNMFCFLSAEAILKSFYADFKEKLTYFKQLNPIEIKSNSWLDNWTESAKSRFSDRIEELKKNVTQNRAQLEARVFLNNLVVEKWLFYASLSLIALFMFREFVSLTLQTIRDRYVRWRARKNCRYCSQKKQSQNCCCCDDVCLSYYLKKSNEMKYVKQLLKAQNHSSHRYKRISLVKHLLDKYVYENRRYFRYSKQFVNTNVISFVLVFYLTSLMIRKSHLLIDATSGGLIFAIKFTLMSTASSETSFLSLLTTQSSQQTLEKFLIGLFESLKVYIVVAALVTAVVYVVQLVNGIKKYQRNVLNAYKGVYVDIPSPRKFSKATITSNYLQYR